MTCKNCGKDNRPEARYCRFCGSELEAASTQKGLIGKDQIAPVLDELDKKLKVAKEVVGGTKMGLDCLILGDTGSGKNFVAHLIANKMLAAGVAKQAPKEVDAADWAEFLGDFDKKIAALKDGILLITNAQKLLPTTKATDVNQLDKLFHRMRNTEGAPIVLMCGLQIDISQFLENNKDVHRLIEFDFQLPAFSLADLTELTLQLLKEKYNADIADDLLPKLNAHFAWYMRQKDLGHTNGHLAEKVAEDLYVKAKYRGSRTIEAQDIDISECFIPRTEEQILAELDDYIGLQSVKDEIRAIVKNVKARKDKGVKEKLL